MTSEIIDEYRAVLAEAVESGGDINGPADNLLYQNVSLGKKFRILDFCKMLQQNAESPESLKKFLNALNILEKYGRHLLKPAESRSNMWRHIKYSNTIFRERISTVKGGLDMMGLMGYTEHKQDGVAFPDSMEPDHSKILGFVTDIVLGRRELDKYLASSHPNPSTIEQYLAPQLIAVFNKDAVKIEPSQQHFAPSSQSAFTTYPTMPAGSMPAFTHEQQPETSVMGYNGPSAVSHMEPYTLPAPHQMPMHLQSGKQHLSDTQWLTNPMLYNMPQTTGHMMSHMRPGVKAAMPYSHSEGNLQHGQGKEPRAEMGYGGHYAEPNLMSRAKSTQYFTTVEQPGAVMGGNYQENMARNRGQYLQQNAEQAQTGTQQQQHLTLDVEKARELQVHDIEGKAPSIACDICGENHAIVICMMCDNKQLCKDCNVKWHNHPKRQNHKLELIRPSSEEVMRESGETPHVYETLRHSGRTPQMVPYTLPQQSQGQTKHGEEVRPAPHYHHKDPSTGSPARYGSSGSPSQPLAAGFPYGRPSMVSQMQGAIHYPVSSTMLHPGHQMGYPMSQGIPQYPASYYSGLYMQPVQGYINPVGSNAPPQLHGMTQGHSVHQGMGPGAFQRPTDTQASSATVEVVQNIPYAIASTKVAQPPDVFSQGSNLPTDSVSELLPGIKMITDLNKQLSRLDVHIMTLNDDLKEWEEKINYIILNNPNFFQDEDYKNLNRKKRKHLQEKMELEKYKEELEKNVAEKQEREYKEKEEIERKAREVETLKKRFDQIRSSKGQDHLSSSPLIQEPPADPFPNAYMLPGNQHDTEPVAVEPAGPETTTYRHNVVQSVGNENRPRSGSENCPNLNLGSLDDVAEDIKRMLVLDVNPHDPSTYKMADLGKKQQILANQAGAAAAPADPYNSQNQYNENKLQVDKNMSGMKKIQGSVGTAGEGTKWECKHCTYRNDFPIKACEMCSNTSVNPRRFNENKPVRSTLTEELIKGTENGEPCEHCTYNNEPGTRVCKMCNKTQLKYDSKKPIQENNGKSSFNKKGGNKSEVESEESGAAVGAVSASGVGKLIEEEQDQVYLEKKAARERFERMNRAAMSEASTQPGASEGDQGKSKFGKMESDAAEQEINIPNEKNQAAANQSVKEDKSPGPANRNVHHSRESSESNGSAYNSAHSSLGGSDSKPRVAEAQGIGKGSKAPQLNFVEAIEQIHLKRDQEQMSLDGHDMIKIIKEAERAGYDIGEVEIAIQHCVEEKLSPLEWLHTRWSGMIDTVAAMATENGKLADQNDVGDLSTPEAKMALIECKGEVNSAITMCVQDRKEKYATISEQGEYAREDVLTALYQNHGDVEEAIDQLNGSFLQSYIDRLWKENEERGGDAAIAAAARSRELSNSVCNSVINQNNFQNLVTDTGIDKERRIRMVFVEAKLKSWGRAETVINILDNDFTNSEAPLECTLEDIIEAVRNCNGDRKSSLIFLKQECAVCFGLFPMSKIQSLGFCQCLICRGCVKMHFEVSIKEKFVRNWGCPSCQCPDTEEESKAGPYFEFLHLILQSLVSKEVVEMYAMKLRDWSLQKDKNFRWCAHCASGFIWDRPDVLGMTCPNCRQKTCFKCKIKWEEQHEGLTCEQFEQWKIDNDPEKQAMGVKLYLEENGIDCPSCKMRYSLAKGGCMHFKCFQCGFEFCSGCSQAFVHQGACEVLKSCKDRGLHCHHPRDCFYYLRDSDTEDLQKLLKMNKTEYNTETPVIQADKKHCPVMEQKEYGLEKKDEPCGKDVEKGMAGLCVIHYKEYLVGLINKNKIDPIAVMSLQGMKTLIERHEKQVPQLGQNEAEGAYRKRLMQFIKERWQLQR